MLLINGRARLVCSRKVNVEKCVRTVNKRALLRVTAIRRPICRLNATVKCTRLRSKSILRVGNGQFNSEPNRPYLEPNRSNCRLTIENNFSRERALRCVSV